MFHLAKPFEFRKNLKSAIDKEDFVSNPKQRERYLAIPALTGFENADGEIKLRGNKIGRKFG